MPVIETRALTKRYRDVLAVDAISFSVESGQVFGFLGPNGSGKTTTIGMLLGIITPSSGEVHLLGRSGRDGLHAARQQIGATLETPNFYPYLSGWDNLRIVANLKGVAQKGIEETLELVGLLQRRKDKFEGYSLGMKQRLAIAATLLGNPQLVILDEPANGLDPDGMREIRELIVALGARGKTVFVSSHLLNEVERTCTHVAILRKGRIVRQASVQELLNTAMVVELRGGDVETLQRAAQRYPKAESVRTRDGAVLVQLQDDDSASLNRWLAGEGVYVSVLAPQRLSLEEAFIDLTRDDATSLHDLTVTATRGAA
ncbi:MAG: ABC transporter ATP-binding protein [Gemmatimonadaceae bacterium]